MVTAELIRRGARRYGDRTAVLAGDDSLTFSQVDELANRLAKQKLTDEAKKSATAPRSNRLTREPGIGSNNP